MAGNLCFMCGLDFRSVKLTSVQTFDEKGRATTVTACEHCKGMMLKNNHPMNQNIEQGGDPNVQGFVKPSSQDHPPIRPQ